MTLLCIHCRARATCQSCGGSAAPQAQEQRFHFWDSEVGVGTWTSNPVQRAGRNLVIEAFPSQPGTATVTVLDAPVGGALTQCTDANAVRSNLTGYTKWLVKGVLSLVGVKVAVSSGAWFVSATFTDESSERGQYYDRSPVTKAGSFLLNTGPVSSTVMLSYTVLGGRKADIELVTLGMQRTAGATSDNNPQIQARITPAGGSPTPVLILQESGNVVGTLLQSAPTSIGFQQAGDTLDFLINDTSLGGVVSYWATYKLTEHGLG